MVAFAFTVDRDIVHVRQYFIFRNRFKSFVHNEHKKARTVFGAHGHTTETKLAKFIAKSAFKSCFLGIFNLMKALEKIHLRKNCTVT